MSEKNDLPYISVIIPCYNQAQFLPEAVKSIVMQTYPNWEIIIVNDGSPDKTSFLAKMMIENYHDKQIALLEKKNGDIADARNAGIKISKGNWILPLDADDMFKHTFLEKAVKVILENPDVNIVTCNLITFGLEENKWTPPPFSTQNILDNTNFIYASLFTKKLWNDAGGYSPALPWGAEDWNFWIDCSKFGINYQCINEELFLYRLHSMNSKVSTVINHYDELRAMIKTLHPDLYSKSSILHSHKIISKIQEDTLEVLDKRINDFPSLSMPYFWKGLFLEEKGHIRCAMENYNKSAELSRDFDWQSFLRLSLLHKELNRPEKAIEYFNEFNKRKSRLESLKKGLFTSVF